MDTNRRFFTPGGDSNAPKLDTLDLLQKWVEFKVVNRGDQVEAQRKSRSPITIPLTQDTKHFQLAKICSITIRFRAAAVISFFTPIGHHGNLLIYGPGRYQFGDFVRVGVPLTLIIAVIVAFMAPILWPG